MTNLRRAIRAAVYTGDFKFVFCCDLWVMLCNLRVAYTLCLKKRPLFYFE